MKALEKIIENIDERIEKNKRDLNYIKENGISMNSCGAGFAQGAIDELISLKDEILVMQEYERKWS